jgi:hypothetical protein
MKSKMVVKFLLALALGAIFGQLAHQDHEKWRSLGREAFLSYQANQFDQHAVASAAGTIIVCSILALGLFALYEGIAFAGVKLISRILSGKSASPGISA